MINGRKPLIIRCIDIVKSKGLLGFIKKINKRHFYPLKNILYPYALIRIKKVVNRNYTVEEAVNFSFKGLGGFIRSTQFESEILNLAKIFEKLQPKTILEIGTSTGGTFFIWSRLSPKDAFLISIDLPGGESNWAYPRWKESFYRKFASGNQKIELIRGYSQDEQTVNRLRDILGDKKIDFLFIDGDHSYEGVKKDYMLYSPFVRKGGVIAFHDIIKFPEETNVGVKQLWDEVKQQGKFQEFIENSNQDWGGIGVMFV